MKLSGSVVLEGFKMRLSGKITIRSADSEPSCFSVAQWAVIICLFLATMNFVGRFYYCVFFAGIVLMMMNRGLVRLPRTIIPVLILAMALVLFSPMSHQSMTNMIKPFAYPLCVLLGNNLMSEDSGKGRGRQLLVLILCLSAGALAHYVLNLWFNWGSTIGRNTIDFWSREAYSATGQATLACMAIGVAVMCICTGYKLAVKVFAVIVLLVVMYYNLVLAGRMIFMLISVCIIVAILFRLYLEKKSLNRMKIIAGVGIGAICVIMCYRINLLSVQEVIQNSNFFDRFFGEYATEIAQDGRAGVKWQYILRMLDHPIGGLHIRSEVGGYAHDVLLDTYDEGGFLAFGAVLCMLFDFVIKCFNLCTSDAVADNVKMLVVCQATCILLVFMIEPILAGVQWLFACFCVIYGAIGRICWCIKADA